MITVQQPTGCVATFESGILALMSPIIEPETNDDDTFRDNSANLTVKTREQHPDAAPSHR
jgi:hypothetical protein